MSKDAPSEKAEKSDTYRRKRMFPRTLAQCVDPVTKPVFTRHGLLEARIIRDWERIVGAEMSACTLPQKLAFPRGKTTEGCLTILAMSGHALTLQYRTPVIMENLAAYFGYKAISRIMIQQVHQLPVPARPEPHITYYPPAAAETDPQDPLQAALARLGRAMQRND